MTRRRSQLDKNPTSAVRSGRRAAPAKEPAGRIIKVSASDPRSLEELGITPPDRKADDRWLADAIKRGVVSGKRKSDRAIAEILRPGPRVKESLSDAIIEERRSGW